MNNKNMIGNGSKATLPDGKKMEDYKKPPTFNNQANINNSSNNGDNSDPDSTENKKNNKSGEEEKPKNKAEQVGGQVASEALKKSLKAAFPIIPQFMINKLVDSKIGQEAIEKTLKGIKKKIILIGLGIAGTALMWIFTITMFFSLVAGPVAWVSDAISNIGTFFSSLGHWFIGDGWCSGAECQVNAEKDYYETLNKAVEKYSGQCKINEDLITATIFYGQMVSEEELDLENQDDGSKNYYDFLDVKEGLGSPSAKSQINKLVRVYLNGENLNSEDLSDETESELIDIDANSCINSTNAYRNYLINTYIDWAYGSVVTEKRTKEEIADDILRMGNIALINRSFSSSIYCPSIAVTQADGSTESMDLEDYVARVVTNENSWYEGNNIENMKAQAVAARTYALNYTNNCKNAISNSTSTQTLAATANAMAVRAAEETNSLVLLENGKVFSTQYDALAIASEDTDNYYLKQANLAIPKTWLDSKVTASQYEYYAAHHHGNGMSQWGSRYLQTIGKSYEDILGTFYTMAEISKMGGLLSGGNYSSNIGPAADVNELAERRDSYAGSLNVYSASSGNVSQCPWYAKSRAIEIVYGSDMPDDLKQTAINSLRATNGNGTDWFRTPDSTIFTKVTDYTQPQPGSIVSWSTSTSEGCSHNYGHVAIIEQVMEDGTLLISDSYNKGGADSGNSWSKISYQVNSRTLDYVKEHKSGRCTYRFNGYVYLLG